MVLAACVWSESINVALARCRANQSGSGLGKLHESVRRFLRLWRLSRERLRTRGRTRRLLEYMEPAWFKNAPMLPAEQKQVQASLRLGTSPVQDPTGRGRPALHEPMSRSIEPSSFTSAASRRGLIRATAWKCTPSDGRLLGEAPLGNRKDIRNAVEAARKAASWTKATAHNRAQVLYYCAENLSQRRDEIAHRLAAAVGEKAGCAEVDSASSASSPMRHGPISLTARCTILLFAMSRSR
jgi:aldehyde dehydrogenase (NAD+)